MPVLRLLFRLVSDRLALMTSTILSGTALAKESEAELAEAGAAFVPDH